ncbi:hypothetical protein V1504DRAFT_456337 [Lipomyces starkeyi]
MFLLMYLVASLLILFHLSSPLWCFNRLFSPLWCFNRLFRFATVLSIIYSGLGRPGYSLVQ